MSSLRVFLLRLRATLFRRPSDARLDEELRTHVEMLVEDLVRAGMPPADARRQARLRLGGIEQTAERVRDRRGLPLIDQLAQDLRYAVRTLAKTPAFTVLAVLTLALGIGANTAIFTVINSVLLRPLRFDTSDRLVRFTEVSPSGEAEDVASDNMGDWRQRTTAFDSMTTVNPWTRTIITRDGPEQVGTMAVTADFFRVFRLQPAVGRSFQPHEYPRVVSGKDGFERPEPPSVAIVSDRFWRRAFGGSSHMLGSTMRLELSSGSEVVTIVGVMPPETGMAETPEWGEIDCWVPTAIVGSGRRARFLGGYGRLRAGVNLEQAQREVDKVAADLSREYPKSNGGWRVRVTPLQETIVGDVRSELRVLAGAVAFVLLIACANVANLLLARTAGRRVELATRAALGASRPRLLRQLLTESLLVSLLGCLIGLALAWVGVRLLLEWAPPTLPRTGGIHLDAAASLFSVVLALFAAGVCGIAPALRSSKIDLNTALKDSGPTTGSRRAWLTHGLVTAQTALALVLLVGAGLMMRTFVHLQRIDLGFDPAQVLTVGLNPSAKYYAPGHWTVAELHQQLLPRVQRLPGVERAATGMVPLAKSVTTAITDDSGHEPLRVFADAITPDYFSALRIPLLAGRPFYASDCATCPPVAIVSRKTAARLWPGSPASAVGRRISTSRRPATVVGVVGDVRGAGLEKDTVLDLYLPDVQTGWLGSNTLIVRVAGDPKDVLPGIRAAVRSIDPTQAVSRIATIDERISREIAPRRFNLFVLGVFSVLAFVLAAVGVYGVVSHSVAMRTREIGIRMALGANRPGVLRAVATRGIALVMVGNAIGLLAAVALNRVMRTMVFGVTTTDALTYVTVTVLWAAVAVLACYVPARRATRIDPLAALRCE